MHEFLNNNKRLLKITGLLLTVYVVLYLFLFRSWNNSAAALKKQSEEAVKKIAKLYPMQGTDIQAATQQVKRKNVRLHAHKKELQEATVFVLPAPFELREEEARPAVYFKKLFANKYEELRQYAATRNIDIPPELGLNVSDIEDSREEIRKYLKRLAVALQISYSAIESKFSGIPYIQPLPEMDTGAPGVTPFISETRFAVVFKGTPAALVSFLAMTGKPETFLSVRRLKVLSETLPQENPGMDPAAAENTVTANAEQKDLRVEMEIAALAYRKTEPVAAEQVAEENKPARIMTGYR